MKGNYMRKLDLKDAYFTIPLHIDSRQLVRFLWEGNLYEFSCLCFRLWSSSINIYKNNESTLNNFKKIVKLHDNYLDDMLLIGRTMEETIIARDNVTFLWQHLGLLQNLKNSVIEPTKKIQFLGLIMNSLDMKLPLTAEKLEKVQRQCQSLLVKKATFFVEVTKK